jgi:hypothetical protein
LPVEKSAWGFAGLMRTTLIILTLPGSARA